MLDDKKLSISWAAKTVSKQEYWFPKKKIKIRIEISNNLVTEKKSTIFSLWSMYFSQKASQLRDKNSYTF